MSNSTVFGPGSTISSGWLNDVNSVVYGSLAGAVTSFNTRSGAVTLLNTDVVSALGYSPLSGINPTFSGTVTYYGGGSPIVLNTSPGTAGQVLTSAGAGATPTWTTPSGGGGSGTVTTLSVVSANGFTGTVANPTTTPAITLTTSLTGLLKGNGTAMSVATAGTDYIAPGGALGTPSSGTLTNCTFPTLNQNTTGSAGSLTTNGTATTPVFTGTREIKVAMGAANIDCAAGNVFTKTISGSTTLTVSNIPASGNSYSFCLVLTNGGSATVTWFSGVKWAGGTPPTLTTSGRDRVFFMTEDGGTTWDASINKGYA